MTIKEFKRCMQVGLGRCYLELRDNPDIERYREVVQWGCLHNLAYDTQAEGSRAEYVYRLVKCFPDPLRFLPAVIRQFAGTGSAHGGGWTHAHFVDLLVLYAKDGAAEAKEAIWQRFRRQWGVVSRRRKPVHYIDYEIEILDRTAIAIIDLDGVDAGRTLAKEYNKLLGLGLYTGVDFEWLTQYIVHYRPDLYSILQQEESEDTARFCRALRRAMAEKTHLDRLLAGEDIPLEDLEEEDPIVPPVSGTDADEDEGADYDEEPAAEPTEPVDLARINLLRDLENEPNKFDFDYLVYLTATADAELAKQAVHAIFSYRGSVAIPYVLQLLQEGPNDWDGVCAVLRNYRPEYHDALLDVLYRMPVGPQHGMWHEAVGIILDAEENHHPLPPEFLHFIYERTLCPHCRAEAVEWMDKYGLVTPAMLAEIPYDCSEDIVDYFADRQ